MSAVSVPPYNKIRCIVVSQAPNGTRMQERIFSIEKYVYQTDGSLAIRIVLGNNPDIQDQGHFNLRIFKAQHIPSDKQPILDVDPNIDVPSPTDKTEWNLDPILA